MRLTTAPLALKVIDMSIVVEFVEEIQIFANDDGGVTILQKSSIGEDDSVVSFQKSHIQQIIKALREIQKELKNGCV